MKGKTCIALLYTGWTRGSAAHIGLSLLTRDGLSGEQTTTLAKRFLVNWPILELEGDLAGISAVARKLTTRFV